MGRGNAKQTVKLASKVIRARSESYTESDDASYASEINSNDSSESSTATTASAASSKSSNKSSSSKSSVTSANNPAKCSITRVTVPRKIIIKYSATIESPVVAKPPLAIIGQTNSEASDVVESDFSESDADEDVEEEEDDEEEDGVGDGGDDTEQSNGAIETETESEESEEKSEDETEEITETASEESEESEDEESTTPNGFASNGTKKSKGYDMDDFKILKTIGKWKLICVTCFCLTFSQMYFN